MILSTWDAVNCLLAETPDEISVHCTVDKLVEGLQERAKVILELHCEPPLPRICVQTLEILSRCFCHVDLALCFLQSVFLRVLRLLPFEEPVFLMESLPVSVLLPCTLTSHLRFVTFDFYLEQLSLICED